MNTTDPVKLAEEVVDRYSGKPNGRVKHYLLAAKIVMVLDLLYRVYGIFTPNENDPSWNLFDDSLWEGYTLIGLPVFPIKSLLLVVIFVALVQLGLFISGMIGLFTNRRMVVKTVSLYGRIGIVLLLVDLFIEFILCPVGIWAGNDEWVYFIVSFLMCLFLSSLDYIPSMREYARLKPHPPQRLILRASACLIVPAVLVLSYVFLMIDFVPKEVRNLRLQPFDDLEAIYTAPPDLSLYQWNEGSGFYLRKDMRLIEPVNKMVALRGWKNGQGAVIAVTTEYVFPDDLRSKIGIESPFVFEREVWNAGLFSGDMLIIKTIKRLAGSDTIYILESSNVNVIIHHGKLEDERWRTAGLFFLANGSFIEITSDNPAPNESLAPVMMTIERYRKGGG